MATAKVTFTNAVINKQSLGSDADHMFSQVSFSAEFDGSVHRCTAVVQQPHGVKYEESFEIHDVVVDGKDGRKVFSYQSLRTECESFFKNHVVKSVGGAGVLAALKNCRIVTNERAEVELANPEERGAW